MNKNDLWLLFKNTGKIEYYIKYKNYNTKKEEVQENDKAS